MSTKKIKVKSKEDFSDRNISKKEIKWEKKKKNIEEAMKSKKTTNEEDNTEMRGFISNLDGYSRSRGISIVKHEGESNKDRNVESKTIFEASKQNAGNQSDQPIPTKEDIFYVKSMKDIEIEKNDEGKTLVIKDQCLNKKNRKQIME